MKARRLRAPSEVVGEITITVRASFQLCNGRRVAVCDGVTSLHLVLNGQNRISYFFVKYV